MGWDDSMGWHMARDDSAVWDTGWDRLGWDDSTVWHTACDGSTTWQHGKWHGTMGHMVWRDTG